VQVDQFAMMRSTDPRVEAFASNLTDDFSSAVHIQAMLQTLSGVQPVESAESAAAAADAAAEVASLQTFSGASFDRAYVQAQVAALQRLLMLFQTRLIPSAQGSQLQALMATEAMFISSDLATAQQLAMQLGILDAGM
jgi:predicted outer membrane protein